MLGGACRDGNEGMIFEIPRAFFCCSFLMIKDDV
jgi:hypothetical protein